KPEKTTAPRSSSNCAYIPCREIGFWKIHALWLNTELRIHPFFRFCGTNGVTTFKRERTPEYLKGATFAVSTNYFNQRNRKGVIRLRYLLLRRTQRHRAYCRMADPN